MPPFELVMRVVDRFVAFGIAGAAIFIGLHPHHYYAAACYFVLAVLLGISHFVSLALLLCLSLPLAYIPTVICDMTPGPEGRVNLLHLIEGWVFLIVPYSLIRMIVALTVKVGKGG